MTIQQLKATNSEKTTVYVDFVDPIKGRKGGRLISVSWRYARVMFANGEVVACDSEDIASIR